MASSAILPSARLLSRVQVAKAEALVASAVALSSQQEEAASYALPGKDAAVVKQFLTQAGMLVWLPLLPSNAHKMTACLRVGIPAWAPVLCKLFTCWPVCLSVCLSPWLFITVVFCDTVCMHISVYLRVCRSDWSSSVSPEVWLPPCLYLHCRCRFVWTTSTDCACYLLEDPQATPLYFHHVLVNVQVPHEIMPLLLRSLAQSPDILSKRPSHVPPVPSSCLHYLWTNSKLTWQWAMLKWPYTIHMLGGGKQPCSWHGLMSQIPMPWASPRALMWQR